MGERGQDIRRRDAGAARAVTSDGTVRQQAFIARQSELPYYKSPTKNSIYDDGGRQRADDGHARVKRFTTRSISVSVERPLGNPTARRERSASAQAATRRSPQGHRTQPDQTSLVRAAAEDHRQYR